MPTRIPNNLIIAIDGPAGSGKSTTAKALAERLRLPYIDTGAMYRAVTLAAMRKKIPFGDIKRLVKIAKQSKINFKNVGAGFKPALTNAQKVFLNGKDVTAAIRDPELTQNVQFVAREPLVRREMVKKQRVLGQKAGAVMEGRDIGTVVFPKADYKFYFDADPRIRAKRRLKDLNAVGATRRVAPTLTQVCLDIERRDQTDYKRKEGPLKQAKDAIRLDTTHLTIDETVDKILQIIRKNRAQRSRPLA